MRSATSPRARSTAAPSASASPAASSYIVNAMYKHEHRQRHGRHLGPLHAGLPGAVRCDQPRRLDRSRQDPGGADGDRSEAGPAHDRLSRREVRRARARTSWPRRCWCSFGARVRAGLAAAATGRLELPFKGWASAWPTWTPSLPHSIVHSHESGNPTTCEPSAAMPSPDSRPSVR